MSADGWLSTMPCGHAERRRLFERAAAGRRKAVAASLAQIADGLAALAIEADYPDWQAHPTPLGWYAHRRTPLGGGRVAYRPILGADDPGRLRAAIASFGA